MPLLANDEQPWQYMPVRDESMEDAWAGRWGIQLCLLRHCRVEHVGSWYDDKGGR